MKLETLQADPVAFRDFVYIDADAGPVRCGPALDPWQRDDFLAIDPGLRRVAASTGEGLQRFWLERGRGHSKTTDIAVCVTWLLFASRRKLNGVACAADKDQAALIRDAIVRLLRLNGWLGKLLKIQADKIVNPHTGSTLTILSSDAASSYGLLIDFAVVDEITHWGRRDLWDSIFSAAAKRKNCLLLCICNAGFTESWQWDLREAIRTDPNWVFRRLDGPVASWISPESLAEQERLLPSAAYSRLWLNQWQSGSGDALESADIDAAVNHAAGALSRAERGYAYTLGVDLGLKRDASALVLLGKHVGHSTKRTIKAKPLPQTFRAMADLDLLAGPEDRDEWKHHPGDGRLKLAGVQIWSPAEGRVELADVERAIVRYHENFHLTRVSVDPWQAEYLIERLSKLGIPVVPTAFTGSNLQAMASSVLAAFRERQIELYPHRELLADLRALRIVEKSYGFRLQPGENGGTAHGDAGTALALSLLAAKQIQGEFTLTSNRQLVFS